MIKLRVYRMILAERPEKLVFVCEGESSSENFVEGGIDALAKKMRHEVDDRSPQAATINFEPEYEILCSPKTGIIRCKPLSSGERDYFWDRFSASPKKE